MLQLRSTPLTEFTVDQLSDPTCDPCECSDHTEQMIWFKSRALNFPKSPSRFASRESRRFPFYFSFSARGRGSIRCVCFLLPLVRRGRHRRRRRRREQKYPQYPRDRGSDLTNSVCCSDCERIVRRRAAARRSGGRVDGQASERASSPKACGFGEPTIHSHFAVEFSGRSGVKATDE